MQALKLRNGSSTQPTSAHPAGSSRPGRLHPIKRLGRAKPRYSAENHKSIWLNQRAIGGDVPNDHIAPHQISADYVARPSQRPCCPTLPCAIAERRSRCGTQPVLQYARIGRKFPRCPLCLALLACFSLRSSGSGVRPKRRSRLQPATATTKRSKLRPLLYPAPPHMGCVQSSSIISALCMLLVWIRSVSPSLPCSPDDRITSHPVELVGSDQNPSCSRVSGSGWRDHPFSRRVSAQGG